MTIFSLVLMGQQIGIAQESPDELAKLCAEEGRVTLRHNFEVLGKRLYLIDRYCNWAGKEPIIFREDFRNSQTSKIVEEKKQEPKVESIEPTTEFDEVIEEIDSLKLDQKNSDNLTHIKKEDRSETLESSNIKPSTEIPVEKESLVETNQSELKQLKIKEIKINSKSIIETLTEKENNSKEQLTEDSDNKNKLEENQFIYPESYYRSSNLTGWQISTGLSEISYQERGHEILIQGKQFGLRYQRINQNGLYYGVGNFLQSGTGQATIDNVSGKLDWESLGLLVNGGWEIGKQATLRLKLGVLVGWQEDRLSYQHRVPSGRLQFSETIKKGGAFGGFEVSPAWQMTESFVMGMHLQQLQGAIQIKYGDGTEAELVRKPSWQIWIEYRDSEK